MTVPLWDYLMPYTETTNIYGDVRLLLRIVLSLPMTVAAVDLQ